MLNNPPAPTRTQLEQIARAIDPNARIVSTRKLTGGTASRMDVLELDPNTGSMLKVVIRQYSEQADPLTGARQRVESKLLRIFTANRVPAPRLVVGEDEITRILGRPAIVISYIDGTPDVTPADFGDWARQVARATVQVHALEVPQELKVLPRSYINTVTKWMAAGEPPEKFTKHILGAELWDTMRELWPGVDTSANQLIHADLWPGNTLWKDGTLLAIIDWEWPALGEPSSDVAFFLTDVAYVGFDIERAFVEAYEQASGRPVRDLRFWKMMAAAIPLPDPGHWSIGYARFGAKPITIDENRRAHSEYIQKLLNEAH